MELTSRNLTDKYEKNKVEHLEIITECIEEKPYYSLRYRFVGGTEYFIGYSSYDLNIVLNYIKEYFTVVETPKHEVYDDAPEHKCCVCGKSFKMFPRNRYVSCSQINLLTFPTYYDTFDCPWCGCQNRIDERYSRLDDKEDVSNERS